MYQQQRTTIFTRYLQILRQNSQEKFLLFLVPEEDYRDFRLRQNLKSCRKPIETNEALAEDTGETCLTEDEICESRLPGLFLDTDERLYFTAAIDNCNS